MIIKMSKQILLQILAKFRNNAKIHTCDAEKRNFAKIHLQKVPENIKKTRKKVIETWKKHFYENITTT